MGMRAAGSWLADTIEKRRDTRRHGGYGSDCDSDGELPWAMQVSLQQWQIFLQSAVVKERMTSEVVERLFAQFEQKEPVHAANVRSLAVAGGAPGALPSGATGVTGGNTASVPTRAAEV